MDDRIPDRQYRTQRRIISHSGMRIHIVAHTNLAGRINPIRTECLNGPVFIAKNRRRGHILFQQHGTNQGQAMILTGRHRHHTRQAFRNLSLPGVIISPDDYCAVGLTGHAVVLPRRNGYDIGQILRYVALAVIVIPPRHDRSVGLERQTVELSAGNCHDIRQIRRHTALVETIVAPSHNRSSGP